MKPIPGKQYTVVAGDDLESIAAQAYGNPTRARGIFNANQISEKSDDWRFVQAGTVLIIPVLADFAGLREAQRS